MSRFLISILFFFSINGHAQDIDYGAIGEQLRGEGLGGRIHSSVEDQGLFVFTWRHPNNFFINVQLPMTTESEGVAKTLATLKRHDFVVLKGDFVDNKSPIKHLRIDDIVRIEKWTGLGSDRDYKYLEGIPEEIFSQDESVFKVHAVANGGAVLVVEYKDRVFPVFNRQPQKAAALYRNDKVILKYEVRAEPLRPAHLEVDYSRDEPITVVEKITKGHGERFTLEGPLVMFAKSPQIKFNIFAVKLVDQDGEQRNYTITTDMAQDPQFDRFFKILERLQKVWDEQSATAQYDRNKFVNLKIQIKVSGIKNVVSPSQANPQVFVEDLEELQVTVLPAVDVQEPKASPFEAL